MLGRRPARPVASANRAPLGAPTATTTDAGATVSDAGHPEQPGDEQWLPPTRGGRRRRRVLRVVLVLVLLPLLYAGSLAVVGAASIDRVAVDGLDGAAGVTNVLVVGSDSREGLSQEERSELTTGGDTGPERTDTILLVQTRGSAVAMLSFPRDLWVERCDGSSQRINTAVQQGGVGCLVRTIQQTSGIGIDHVVQVGFGGFVQVVDAVGGVELCLPRAIADRDAGIDLPAGCQVLGGADALGYVRVRKIDDDLQRIKRQQEFLAALAGEVASPATMLVPWRGLPTVRAIGEAVTTDTGVGPVTMARLAVAARGLASGGAHTVTVPTTATTIDGASVLLASPEAEGVYASFRDGSVLGLAATSVGSAAPRADTRVVVLNGSRVGGLARQTSDALETAGYAIGGVGNADAVTRTAVQHPAGLRAEAERLADDVAAVLGTRPQVREGADGGALTLVLGTDLQ